MIRDILDMILQSNLAKGLILGSLALVAGCLWIVNIQKDQNDICQKAGFGKYSEENQACEVNDKYVNDIIIVAGNTANTPKPQITEDNKELYPYLKNSIAAKSNIRFVSAATDMGVEKIDTDYKNESNNAEGFIESLNNTISSINEKISSTPHSNGATYLEAIMKAGRDAASTSLISDNKTLIFVIGSGLSDGGILNFAEENLLQKQESEIIDQLEKTNQLNMSLNGVSIIWSGIGQVAAPQKELSDGDTTKLKNIYQTVLEKRGANINFADHMLLSETIENNQYTVKPTSVSIIDIPTNDLGFKADSSEIEDKQKAIAALKDVIDMAKANPSRKVTVTGYMASGKCGEEAKHIDTSLAGERAHAVKNLLHGIIDNEIDAINGEVFEPEKTECPNGAWSPEAADYRRKVTVEV